MSILSNPQLRRIGEYPYSIYASDSLIEPQFFGISRNTTIGVMDNAFVRVDRNMNELWRTTTEYDPAGIAWKEDRIYAHTWEIMRGRGDLKCMAIDNGEIIWQRKLMRPSSWPSAKIFGDNVCLVVRDHFASFRLTDGKPGWKHLVGQISYPPAFCCNQKLIYVGSNDGNVICVDSKSGRTVWTQKIGKYEPKVALEDGNLFAGCMDGPLKKLDATSGQILESSDVHVRCNLLCDSGCLYFQTEHNNETGYRIGSVNAATLEVRWNVDVPFSRGNALYSPNILGIHSGSLVIGTYCGPVYALDLRSGAMQWLIQSADLHVIDPNVTELRSPFLTRNGLRFQANWNIYEAVL